MEVTDLSYEKVHSAHNKWGNIALVLKKEFACAEIKGKTDNSHPTFFLKIFWIENFLHLGNSSVCECIAEGGKALVLVKIDHRYAAEFL